MEPRLPLAVFGIVQQQQRLVQKNLLRFLPGDIVLFLTLPGVPVIPLKSFYRLEVKHIVYMPHIYICLQ